MRIKNIDDFTPQQDQVFIMDTNILIKLMYPIITNNNTASYETLYNKILSVGAKIIVSSIQISEFTNRCIRFQYDLWKKDHHENNDFKSDYRSTDDYRESMNAILEIIKGDILSTSECIDDHFSEMNQDILFQYGFSYDFNDAILAEIARIHKAILITNDRDFASYCSSINIVTGNSRLLMFS